MRLYRAGCGAQTGRHLVLRGAARGGSNTAVLDNVFVPEHRSVSFATLRDAARRARRPTRKSDLPPRRSSPCTAMRCWRPCSAWRAAVMQFRRLDPPALPDYLPAQYRSARAGADPRRRNRGADRRCRSRLARRAFALARQLFNVSLQTRTLLRRDFTYAVRLIHAGRWTIWSNQWLKRADGRQFHTALLARRACHLLARSRELGRAGGEFRPH